MDTTAKSPAFRRPRHGVGTVSATRIVAERAENGKRSASCQPGAPPAELRRVAWTESQAAAARLSAIGHSGVPSNAKWGPFGVHFAPKRPNGRPLGGRSLSEPIAPQQLTKMTRAGFEPATYGLKERPSFIPRGRPSTPKFVPLLTLMRGGVRSRFSELLGVPCTSRDKWGATRVH
jgi:hypothetical protein